MDFTFNAYSIVLLVCGSATIILSNYIYSRGGITVRLFVLSMLAIAIWSITYGLELASGTLKQIKFFINLEYIGVAILPLTWFFFCLHFNDKECWYKKPRNFALAAFIPVVTLFMVWTNDYHHLQYSKMALALDGPFPLADHTPGIWYYVFLGYFYITLACGSYLLINKFRSSDAIYKKQNISILIAALIPWIANIASMLGLKPYGYIDITPYGFILTSFFIIIGIYRFRLFDIIPVAREKVLELMEDGFFVLDQQNRIIDYNGATKKYIAAPRNSFIGVLIDEIFPHQPQLLERLNTHQTGKIEMVLMVNQQELLLEVDVLFLHNNNFHNNFSILKIQDLTHFKKDAIRTK